MMLRTLIVDDEPIARQILTEELEQIEDLRLIGEADNGESALRLIRQELPDMVFLDLQMPAMGGLEVVRKLRGDAHLPVIIIVTAYDRYAIEAFEAGAVDYLLKPVRQDRLVAAVERGRRASRRPAELAASLNRIEEAGAASVSRAPRRIVGRSGEEYVLLTPSEVMAFQAEGDLVWVITAKRKYLATQTLRTLQEALRNTTFRRIHRNALVNIDHVRKMSALSSQRWLITLHNSLEFVVSKRQAWNVRELLGM